MSLARRPEWDGHRERDECPDTDLGLRAVPGGWDQGQDTDGPGSVRTEAVWCGGGSRDAYEALLLALFAPERAPVDGASE
ncbi:MAG TPA: hypothetical protein VHF47_05435 [Acidimicrobiales bacterium]|nr:hypothetical protein [Acidimicrobiales bacterium]